MNLYLHLKWLFRMLSNCSFTTSRAERYSAYKMKVFAQSALENFGFHSEYDDDYEKVFLSHSGLCRPISAILRMLNGCSVLVARKLLQPVTSEKDELKL